MEQPKYHFCGNIRLLIGGKTLKYAPGFLVSAFRNVDLGTAAARAAPALSTDALQVEVGERR